MRAALVSLVILGASCTPPTPSPEKDAGAPILDAGPTPLTDPLSMPAQPTHQVTQFTPAEQCGACHQDQYSAWRASVHAYAMVDPVFQALVGIRQQDFQGRQDRFCVQCHSAIATRGGEVVPGFQFANLSSISKEGVTCDACHRVASMQRDYNSGHVLDPAGPVRGPLMDVQAGNAHPSQYSELLQTSQFCGGCHDVREVNGLPLERPYAEWLESPAAASGKTCQACHMPAYDGLAGKDGPQRQGLHSHRFVGVDVPLEPGFLSETERQALSADVDTLLAQAATITLSSAERVTVGDQLDVEVSIQNNIDAHNLPTGTTFMRQMWLELTVQDAQGAVLYKTGDLDSNGDLRDHFSSVDAYGDPDLIALGSGLINAHGDPELFPWRATEHSSPSLSPLYKRTYTLFVPTAHAAPGALTIHARLRFRSHPPFLLRALGLDTLLAGLQIHDMTTTQRTVTAENP